MIYIDTIFTQHQKVNFFEGQFLFGKWYHIKLINTMFEA